MDIIGYEGLYKIYSNGDVLGLKRNKFVKPHLNKQTGYIQIKLCKDSKIKIFKVHRLLGIHFIPNSENKPCIDHINRDRLDNRIENLRWATIQENNCNTTIKKNNKLGHKNICYNKSDNRFRFKITRNEIAHNKYFKTLEDALNYKNNYLSL
tara:strand:- start:11 stop:466 length:456 start_codon:yes stop_codon:yes gene_type:complete